MKTNLLQKSKVIETRSMPSLLEKRNNLVLNLEGLVNTAKTETRALTPEEQAKFNQTKADIEAMDATITAEQQAQQLAQQNMTQVKTPEQQNEETRALNEAEDKLRRFVRGEERALDIAGNGGIIPTIIANKIIQRVRELSPIYQRATVYNVGGDLVFPVFSDYTTITTAYIADMTALTPANGNFTTIKLQNFIAGALVTLSRSLMNRQDFNLVNFIVEQMALSIANFLENQFLNGVGTTAATGIFVDANATSVTAGSATALTIDDLISTQLAVPEAFQANACWILNKATFAYLRKIKDTTGMPLLLQNGGSVAGGFGWQMLGKDVFVSQNAPATMTTGLKVLAYGDLSGYYVKFAQQVEIQTLNELYATQHAVGVVGYVEFDARVVESQKIAVLKMA